MNMVQAKKRYINVLLPVSAVGILSYSVPADMELKRGDIVEVYLGRRKVTGLAWKEIEEKDIDFDLKKIRPVLRKSNISGVSEELCIFITKIASYTLNKTSGILKMLLSVPGVLDDLPEKKLLFIPDELPEERKTDAREKVFSFLRENNNQAKAQDIIRTAGVSSSVVKIMKDKGLLQEKLVLKAALDKFDPRKDIVDIDLSTKSEQQKVAIIKILEKIKKADYSCTVTDGVTGSGKTEVYCSVIEAMISSNKSMQILVMMPEIMLSERFAEYFENRFSFRIIKWNSSVSLSKKSQYWKEILSGTPCIVIGTRSALFLPFQNLNLIVVDEEHDNSYKQEDKVVYHARDMSVYYANILKIPLLLISATASFETLYNISQGKYDVVRLKERHGKSVLPEIIVVDMKKHLKKKKEWISSVVKEALIKNSERKKQSLLFLNRKGYAPLTLCSKCGYRFMCLNCSSAMVQHRTDNILLCHYCGYKEELKEICPDCNETGSLVACGPGLERIIEEVYTFMPEARILKLDSDSSKNSMFDDLKDISDGKVDIIIGTQIIAKGYHFPDLTLVGILDADSGLAGGDFRASERCYQLLEQVSGRAGREEEKGYVYIQSFMPGNDIISSLAQRNKDKFISLETASRKAGRMPPFTKLTSIIASSYDEDALIEYTRYMLRKAPDDPGIEILGPVASPLYVLNQRYRYRFLIKSEKIVVMQKYLRKWLSILRRHKDIKLKTDIDPYNFL